jgi:hypothetical protein
MANICGWARSRHVTSTLWIQRAGPLLTKRRHQGFPWGITVVNGEIRVLCGEGDGDDRFVRSYVQGRGFGERIACPDNTGSQLGFDGKLVHVSQWYKRRILAIDDSGAVLSAINVPHGICGQVIVDGIFYLVTTDDEAGSDYWRVLTLGQVVPKILLIFRFMPVHSRSTVLIFGRTTGNRVRSFVFFCPVSLKQNGRHNLPPVD